MTEQQKNDNPSENLDQMARRVGDALKLLRTQNEVLNKRGVSLPTAMLDEVAQLQKRLTDLSQTVFEARAELTSLRALANTTALINSSQTRDEVLKQVMDTVIALTGAERGYIVLKNQETGELEFKIARGMDQSQLQNDKLIVSRSIVNHVADTGEPVLTDNASEDAQYQSQESIVGYALRSILAVPLTVRQDVIGVVYCDNRFLSGLFKASDLALLSAFANQSAVAIENARLFESLRASLDQVTELRDRMRNLFNSIASGVITIDNDDVILISNSAAEGILNAKHLIGQNLFNVLPPLNEKLRQRLVTVRDDGTTETLAVEPVLDPAVGARYWSLTLSPLRDVDSASSGIAIVVDDLTEQKHRESQLAEVRRYLPLALVENIRSVEDIDTGAQERTITALFADVRGFTTFSERLEPEELMQVINKYLSLASDAINLFEGIVDKYMGDAVTGLFNTQLNKQEDHAVRAVQAAMQLVMDLYAQHEVMDESDRLYYGIGIHSGAAVLGNVGGKDRKEFAALGEATDVSKYLQEQAGPGQIVISQQTYDLVEHSFECERLPEPVRPKAGYEHIVMYRVLKRRKDAQVQSIFVDQELLDLLDKE